MKNIFFISLFLAFITHSTLLPVYAGGGGAGGAATLDYQIVQDGTNLLTKASTFINTNSTVLNTTKNIILNPIADALINIAIQQASNDIVAWVNGGFQGEPLIIANPERFIKNRVLGQVRVNIKAIPTESIFGDSIFNSLVNQYQEKDVATKIQALSSSNIPSLIQENMCSDAALTALALNSVKSSDGTYNEADLTTKKRELYEYAECGGGNPKTDKRLATKLNNLNKQNPSIGGWDSFLATTGGENDYTRSVLASNIIAEKAKAEEEKRKNEIYLQSGPVSKTVCDEWSEVTEEGEQAVCLNERTTTPGKSVSASLDKAVNSGIERLTNIQGEGALSGLLTTFATAAIMKGFNESFTSSSGRGASNKPITISSARPATQDLTQDATKKTELLASMVSQLTNYKKSLTSLQTTDVAYLGELTSYERRVESIRTCPIAYQVYTNRKRKIENTRISLSLELQKIRTATSLTEEVLVKINASNSSQEISSLFNVYQLRVEKEGLPRLSDSAERSSEYTIAQSNSSNDTELKDLQSSCAQMQVNTP